MRSKSRLLKIESRVEDFISRQKSKDSIKRFLDALDRGVVLCQDGKERNYEDWIRFKGLDYILEMDLEEESES